MLALTRTESLGKLPGGLLPIPGNALDAKSFASAIPGQSTFVHLVGVSRPAPWKARAFREIDLVGARAALAAAKSANVAHFVYVSVAHPAPVMRSYIAVRKECEALLVRSGIPYTILRPWYVLGPGHRWPVVLQPLYSIANRFQSTAEASRRLGLVTVEEMVNAMAKAVELGPFETRGEIWEVPQIRRFGAGGAYATTGRVRNLGRSEGSAV